jgi:hypothetical protein
MNVFNRILINIRNRKQQTKDQDTMTSNSSTSSATIIPTTKRFSSLCWRKKKQSRAIDDKPQSQQLLTQCIETALFREPLPLNDENKRWSFEDVRPSSLRFEQDPIKPARTRKISLPPQLTSIGYLASIPEVDSQVTLELYCNDTSRR